MTSYKENPKTATGAVPASLAMHDDLAMPPLAFIKCNYGLKPFYVRCEFIHGRMIKDRETFGINYWWFYVVS